jgi:hypothetical protein
MCGSNDDGVDWVSAPYVLGFLAAHSAIAQPPSDGGALMFEVASVKVATSGFNGVRGGCRGIDTAYGPKENFWWVRTSPNGAVRHYRRTIEPLDRDRLWRVHADSKDRSGLDSARGPAVRHSSKAEDPSKVTQKQLLTMLQHLLTFDPFFATVKMYPTSDETKVSFTGPNGELMGKPAPGRLVTMTAQVFYTDAG